MKKFCHKIKRYLIPIILLILIIVGIFVFKFLLKSSTVTDPSLSDRAETYNAMTDRNYLIFTELSADPFVTTEGEVQKFILKANDEVGISNINASLGHDLGRDSVDMKLIEGDKYNGTWLVSWKTHDLSVPEYSVIFKAENEGGKEESVTFFWQYIKNL
jgi:hypothetical protein